MTLLLRRAEVDGLLGTVLGESRWLTVTQDMIHDFGVLTHDEQWIHVDVERAGREMGGTIAHGFLTLSLLSTLVADIWTFE
ncbi:MAG: MaoC/PaaZ C-terminal domain-containing protein, partial [Betaproteobacteria bacterium]